MDKSTNILPDPLFVQIYMEALEAALSNDNINLGFHVKGPEDYIDDRYIISAEVVISDNHDRYSKLFEMVDSYFDSLSHYSNDVDGIEAELVRDELFKFILDYKRTGILPVNQNEK
jgi:hypothetical protein